MRDECNNPARQDLVTLHSVGQWLAHAPPQAAATHPSGSRNQTQLLLRASLELMRVLQDDDAPRRLQWRLR